MFVYYAVFILAFLLCTFDYIDDGIVKRGIYISFCTILILLPGLKSIGTDNDSSNYEEIFRISAAISYSDGFAGRYEENTERGYLLLNKVVNSLGGDINSLFLVVALLTGVLNYTLFYKLCEYPFTAVLIYISFFYLYRDFTQIRYGLSCALVFWSVYYFLKPHYLLGFLFFVLSLLIHSTSLILILVLPICYLIKNRYLYAILPVFCLVGLVINPFPILLSLGGVPEHMQIYFDEEGGGGFVVSFIGLLMMALYLFFNRKIMSENFNFSMYYRLLAVGVSLNLLFIQASIFQRFSHLFFQCSVLFLPNVLKELEKSTYKYYFVMMHFLFNCFFLYYGCKLIEPILIRPYFQ
ncbi:EpsG family protein [Pedobacter antarcticus]|uniref:EpsG family protein n=1 Tax=Pedobacter antarcticus TaxID=34086 RepID=UPI0008820671|nr:EpsG family protein [Pedobacter antarcticus]SDM17637.1 EpsG family protein [Pedobacter antarcticus]